MRQELFTASRGEGAQLDGKRIRVSPHIGLERALIGTGFPYRANLHWLDPYMAMLKAVMQATAGIRRPGAAALDLAYVAAGRLDAFWELGLSPWDTAAGTLLITEAGGMVGTPERRRIQAARATSSSARPRCTPRCWNCSRRTFRRTCGRESARAQLA